MPSVKRLGCVAVLLLLPSCASQKAKTELIGLWESADGAKGTSVEFKADGSVVLSGKAMELLDWKILKVFRDFNLQPARKSITFDVPDKEHVEIQGDFTAMMEKMAAGGKSGSKPGGNAAEFRPRETLTFAIAGDELTLSSTSGKSMKFRRSR